MAINRIYIGADHGAFDLKAFLFDALIEKGYQVEDVGTKTADRCDYPDFAIKVGESVAGDEGSYGIALCTSGVGINIAANKVKGVRAALVLNKDQAIMSRRHNDANVLAMGSKYVTKEEALDFTLAWLSEAFEGGRHENRVNKITNYENGV